MKICAVGDLHGLDVWKKINPDDFDKIIFVGDYCDSWDIKSPAILKNMKELIKFKKKNMDKVVLLLGNHDLFYKFYPDPYFSCSGNRKEMIFDLKDLFSKNSKLFKCVHFEGNYVFSHAGITYTWVESAFDDFNGNLNALEDELNNTNNNRLYDCGRARGGFQKFGGPFWADCSETESNVPVGYHQVFGHTHRGNIEHVDYDENTSTTAIDCLEFGSGRFYEFEITIDNPS